MPAKMDKVVRHGILAIDSPFRPLRACCQFPVSFPFSQGFVSSFPFCTWGCPSQAMSCKALLQNWDASKQRRGEEIRCLQPRSKKLQALSDGNRVLILHGMWHFCLQLDASCLQFSFFTYNCVLELFCLQLKLLYLQLDLSCWHCESASNKHLNRLSTEKLNWK